jgi:hypothetical protein
LVGLRGEELLLGFGEAVEVGYQGIDLLFQGEGIGGGLGGFGGQHLLYQGRYFGLLLGRGGGDNYFFEIVK